LAFLTLRVIRGPLIGVGNLRYLVIPATFLYGLSLTVNHWLVEKHSFGLVSFVIFMARWSSWFFVVKLVKQVLIDTYRLNPENKGLRVFMILLCHFSSVFYFLRVKCRYQKQLGEDKKIAADVKAECERNLALAEQPEGNLTDKQGSNLILKFKCWWGKVGGLLQQWDRKSRVDVVAVTEESGDLSRTDLLRTDSSRIDVQDNESRISPEDQETNCKSWIKSIKNCIDVPNLECFISNAVVVSVLFGLFFWVCSIIS